MGAWLFFGSLAIAQDAQAQPRRAPTQRAQAAAEAPAIVGQVAAIQADKSITVEVKQRGGTTRQSEFSIVKDQTKIELLGDAKAIAVGMPVSIWADKDNPKLASRVVVGGSPAAARTRQDNPQPRGQAKGEATVGGTLQGVDTAKNTVTVTTSNRATGKLDKTFEMAKDVVVLRDGKPAKVGELKQGGRISVKLSPDQKTAVSISETGKTMAAPLKSVDSEKNSITLTVTTGVRGAPSEKKDVTHELAKDGKVMLEGKEVQLADLKDVRPGSTIQLTFSVDDEKKLVHIQYTPGRR